MNALCLRIPERAFNGGYTLSFMASCLDEWRRGSVSWHTSSPSVLRFMNTDLCVWIHMLSHFTKSGFGSAACRPGPAFAVAPRVQGIARAVGQCVQEGQVFFLTSRSYPTHRARSEYIAPPNCRRGVFFSELIARFPACLSNLPPECNPA